MASNASPADDAVVSVVADSIESAIREHGANIAFQQVRTTPEGLVVHFSAFDLHRRLQSRWPGQFRVLLEKSGRRDIQVVPIHAPDAPFVFEFKVPWSGDLIARPVVRDLVKVSQYARGYAVTVFLKLLRTPTWADQRVDRYSVQELKQEVIDLLAIERPDLSAGVIRESPPIKIGSEETQIECVATVWRPGAKDDATQPPRPRDGDPDR